MTRATTVSLGRRLSWWLAAQTFIGLCVVCAVVYAVADFSLGARQRDELGQQEEVVRHLLAEAGRSGETASLRHKLDDFFVGHADLRLELRTVAGEPLYASSAITGPSSSLRRSNFLMQFPLPPDGVIRADLFLDTGADAGVLRRLGWTLFACAVAGAAVVSAGGFWLVRRALAPLRDLVAQTRSLDATRLAARLDGSAQAEELQPLVAQFNALLDRLEQSYEQMEGFNADVAHELRTPLATLIGECELALHHEVDLPQAREILGSNLEELHRISEVVNAMLFLSQAARGAPARRQPIASLATLAGEVIEFHDATLQEAGVGARVRGDSAGSFDGPLLRQALSNLLANATRFAQRGSDIEIAVEAAPDAVTLTVTNEGAVIDDQYLPRLFERFYRVEAARQHGEANHGLGLSIVAAIARMHGGTPFARSAGGRTSIGLTVPRQG